MPSLVPAGLIREIRVPPEQQNWLGQGSWSANDLEEAATAWKICANLFESCGPDTYARIEDEGQIYIIVENVAETVAVFQTLLEAEDNAGLIDEEDVEAFLWEAMEVEWMQMDVAERIDELLDIKAPPELALAMSPPDRIQARLVARVLNDRFPLADHQSWIEPLEISNEET